MKSLKPIQMFAKIGKIVSLVIHIVCMVGGIGCIVGIVALAVIPDGFKLGGVTIRGFINNYDNLSIGACYTAMAIGAVVCICEAILAKIAHLYFKHELDAGTPFTFDGAKELLRLGICTVAISVGASILAAITYAVMSSLFSGVNELHFEFGTSIGVGLMFIVMSFFCKYGAEIREQSEKGETGHENTGA